jgi:hypothetical protein
MQPEWEGLVPCPRASTKGGKSKMGAITGCTSQQVSPNESTKIIEVVTPATADSNDTIDVSSATVTGGQVLGTIYGVLGAYDTTTGDAVTATWSSTTITIDAAGGTTNHVYRVLVYGK